MLIQNFYEITAFLCVVIDQDDHLGWILCSFFSPSDESFVVIWVFVLVVWVEWGRSV